MIAFVDCRMRWSASRRWRSSESCVIRWINCLSSGPCGLRRRAARCDNVFAVTRDYAVSDREISYCNIEQAAMHLALKNLALSPQSARQCSELRAAGSEAQARDRDGAWSLGRAL